MSADEFSQIPLDQVIICLGVISILVVVGNTFVLYVFTRPQFRKKSTNMFILSMATADTLVGLVDIPLAIIGFTIFKPKSGSVACYATPYLQMVCVTISVFSMVAITFDRFRSLVLMKQQPRRRVVIGIICLIWIVAILYSLKVPLMASLVAHEEEGAKAQEEAGPNGTTLQLNDTEEDDNLCSFFFESTNGDLAIRYVDSFVLLIIPGLLMAILYSIVGRRLWTQSTQFSRGAAEKKAVVRMLILLAVFFILSWSMFHLYETIHDTISDVEEIKESYNTAELSIKFFGVMMALSNSWVNPLIYFFASKSFRVQVLCLFPCCRGRVTSIVPMDGVTGTAAEGINSIGAPPARNRNTSAADK